MGDITPGNVATVNSDEAIAVIEKVRKLSVLDTIEAAEKGSDRHPGGRKGVLAAIAARRAQLDAAAAPAAAAPADPAPLSEPAPTADATVPPPSPEANPPVPPTPPGEEAPPAEPPAEDLDAVPDEPEEEPEPLPEVDPLDLVSGMVPLYNPFYAPVEAPYNGEVYTIRAQGVDLAPLEAANLAVGADNGGGKLSHTGLRRLYGPEPRFLGQNGPGQSLEQWCEARNAAIKAEADGVAQSYAAQIGFQPGGTEE